MKDKKEMIYVIPLRRVYWLHRRKRAPRAIKLIRSFVERHFGVKRVIIDNAVNEYVWSRSIEKPPRRVKVKVVKVDEETAKVLLAEGSKP